MPFNVDIKDYSKTFTKTKFFVWTPGEHTIRILDEDVPAHLCYWFGSGHVKALGADDPQATLNKRIRMENPDNFKKVKGYRQLTTRYFMNVLDRTAVKICPECGREGKAIQGEFPNVCPICKEGILTGVKAAPLNEVRVLQGGKTLFEQFVEKQLTTKDEEGNEIGVQNFDIKLVVVGTGAQRTTVALVDVGRDEVVVPPDQLYDTTKMIPEVTEEEMEKLVAGVSLRDLLAGRRAEPSTTTASPDVEETSEEAVDDLFADEGDEAPF
jgi:DNA-directed RNA polymerase subunit RPC12/RpoP